MASLAKGQKKVQTNHFQNTTFLSTYFITMDLSMTVIYKIAKKYVCFFLEYKISRTKS